MEELKACPFCEGDDIHPDQFSEKMNEWRYICAACGCWGPERTTQAEAIAAWNRRATPQAPSREEIAELVDPEAFSDYRPLSGLQKRRNAAFIQADSILCRFTLRGEEMKTIVLGKWCAACQAIPKFGYCRLAGCPMFPLRQPASKAAAQVSPPIREDFSND